MAHVENVAEVHVGDTGTTYQVRIYDDMVPFDPTLASVKELTFKLPGAVTLTKTATVVPEGSPVAASWLLTYQVQANDGPGSPGADFHATTGAFKIQAYLEWADGSKYSSNVVTHDEAGRELRIYKNLA